MKKSNRREALKKIAAGTAAVTVAPFISSFATEESNSKKLKLKGNINHSVCQWTYNHIPLEELCVEVKKIGIGAIDLIAPKDWPMLKKYGLYSSMCYIAGKVSLTEGWNNKTFHPQLIKDFSETIPLVKEAGYKNLICFSGNRKGMDDETGMNNCVEGLKQIMGLAEKNGVMIQMELLNSKVDHKDYMCDKTTWGVELVKRVGSPNFKLLYDIYHMQIMEGDVIRTIKDNLQYIGHLHTGGNPGRNEIDETQELNYRAISQAVVDMGYKGYMAHEFIPKRDPMTSLGQAMDLCDV